jgi:hypothetical protein
MAVGISQLTTGWSSHTSTSLNAGLRSSGHSNGNSFAQLSTSIPHGTSADNHSSLLVRGGGSTAARGGSAVPASLNGSVHTSKAGGLLALDEATREATQENWDREGARALSASVLASSRSFVRMLPSWVRAPEIHPDPLGRVIFEWHEARGRVLSASVGSSGGVAYAWHVGDSEGYAADNLADGIPRAILEQLWRLLVGTPVATWKKASSGG